MVKMSIGEMMKEAESVDYPYLWEHAAANEFLNLSKSDLEKNEALKIFLLFLMCNENKDVKEIAKKAAKKHGYFSAKEIYDELSEEGKKKLAEKIDTYCKSEYWGKRCRAIEAIVALNLVDFIAEVVKLCADPDPNVRERAIEAVEELGKSVVLGEVTAEKEQLDILINSLTKSNNPDHKALAERLICLRDEDSSTNGNADEAFMRRGKEQKPREKVRNSKPKRLS